MKYEKKKGEIFHPFFFMQRKDHFLGHFIAYEIVIVDVLTCKLM